MLRPTMAMGRVRCCVGICVPAYLRLSFMTAPELGSRPGKSARVGGTANSACFGSACAKTPVPGRELRRRWTRRSTVGPALDRQAIGLAVLALAAARGNWKRADERECHHGETGAGARGPEPPANRMR